MLCERSNSAYTRNSCVPSVTSAPPEAAQFFLPHVCFDAGASLCVAAGIEKRKGTVQSARELRLIDENVKEAIFLLSSMANENHIAKESYLALAQLRERLYAPNDPAPLAPGVASPCGFPFWGSMMYDL
jgi:hypothetical protein